MPDVKALLVAALYSAFVVVDRYFFRQRPTGSYTFVEEQVTEEVVADHVVGKHTVGVVPLSGQVARWVGIDFDLNIRKHPDLAEALKNFKPELGADGLPEPLAKAVRLTDGFARERTLLPLFEFSGYKGVHAWLFAPQGAEARKLRRGAKALVQKVRKALGPDAAKFKEIEVFPKQDALKPGARGNCMKMPLGFHLVTGLRSVFFTVEPYVGDFTLTTDEAQLGLLQRAAASDAGPALLCITDSQETTPEPTTATTPPPTALTTTPSVNLATLTEQAVEAAVEAVVAGGTRNDTGFKLFVALRDAGVDIVDTRSAAESYHSRVEKFGDHPYPIEDALASVESAYSRPPRPQAVETKTWQDNSKPAVEVYQLLLAELQPKATTMAKVEFLETTAQVVAASGVDRLLAKGLLDELRAVTDAFDADDQKLVMSRVAGLKKEAEDDRSAIEMLLDIGQRDELFHDDKKDAFAAVTHEGVRDVLRVGGPAHKRHLAWRFHLETGSAVGGTAIDSVCQVLAATAINRGPCIKLHKRFAVVDGAVWIALADEKRRAVRVTAEKWEVVGKPPILFELQPHQTAHPDPEGGGNLRELLAPFFNFAQPEDEALFEAWLVVAAVENIPRCAVIIKGAPGSAKSTTAKIGRSCIDPSAVDALNLGNADTAQTAQILSQHEVPVFDNINYLTKDQEPLFCVAITRGAYSTRELYTNGGAYIFRLGCAPILTGVNCPTEAADLLDRSVLVELERIPSDKRREESVIWREFEARRPRIFGAFLDVLVQTMRIHPSVELQSLPRMADWTRWAVAAAEAMGYERDLILSALRLNESSQVEAALEEPVSQALRKLMATRDRWSGTPADLYDKLTEVHGKPRYGDRWPAGPSPLSKRLRVLLPPLTAVGIDIVFTKANEERLVIISKSQAATKDSRSWAENYHGRR
ncbi:MAG: hypothetical protein HY903_11535 [Deltaproteobacteria bacterium]|nr:hypothetical protein [Deltaproteobacteria bacterium]